MTMKNITKFHSNYPGQQWFLNFFEYTMHLFSASSQLKLRVENHDCSSRSMYDRSAPFVQASETDINPANIAPLLRRSGAAERWIRRGGTKAKLTRRAGPSCLTAAPLRGLSVSPLRCSNGASQRSFHVAPLRLKEEAPSAQRSGV